LAPRIGNLIEQVSLWGRRCHHFDFGANLRKIADEKESGQFTPDEIRFLRRVLKEGALLEADRFPLAARILDAFIGHNNVPNDDLLVLNGLPRHLEQARAADHKVRIIGVVQLECDAATVAERLRRNSGGERTRRTDDTDAMVARKLSIYEERTLPLVDHYRRKATPILQVKISAETSPQDVVDILRDWPDHP
jgi:adenylate kinase